MSGKIDRMEILKMALASTGNAKEALALAREMAAFVQHEQEKAPMPSQSVAPISTLNSADTRISHRGGDKERLHWTEEDLKKAANLLDNGATYTQTAKILGRTVEAIRTARSKGKLPIQNHRLNEGCQTRAALAALKRGKNLSEKTLDLLTRPTP